MILQLLELLRGEGRALFANILDKPLDNDGELILVKRVDQIQRLEEF
jgi:hypothetical protein